MTKLFGTAKINQQNHLEIGGCDTTALAAKYGTPLYVYDVAYIKSRIRGFKETFENLEVKNKITYASKAFACIAMYQLVNQEEIAVDVVSGGELYTALKAGVSPENIAFHGNNKSVAELEMAVNEKIGLIMVDNFHELALLEEILQKKQQKQNIMFRLAPGVDAHTHDFIMTGQEDSKFGFDIKSGQAEKALVEVLESEFLELVGIHCHIGSQIFDTRGFEAATQRMLTLLVDWRQRYDYVAKVLNLGGGFGVYYTAEDDPLEPTEYVKQIIQIVKKTSDEHHYPLPIVGIEPGRSIVAEAGTTLYTVGGRKEIPEVRTYVSVDGGMGDNIRTPLYNAKYDALVANKGKGEIAEEVCICGKYCESGDIVIENIALPKLVPNDILAVFTTGAYGYSMASNYNRNPRPAVIFVEDGKSQVVVKRETFEDLIHLDEPLNL